MVFLNVPLSTRLVNLVFFLIRKPLFKPPIPLNPGNTGSVVVAPVLPLTLVNMDFNHHDVAHGVQAYAPEVYVTDSANHAPLTTIYDELFSESMKLSELSFAEADLFPATIRSFQSRLRSMHRSIFPNIMQTKVCSFSM